MEGPGLGAARDSNKTDMAVDIGAGLIRIHRVLLHPSAH